MNIQRCVPAIKRIMKKRGRRIPSILVAFPGDEISDSDYKDIKILAEYDIVEMYDTNKITEGKNISSPGVAKLLKANNRYYKYRVKKRGLFHEIVGGSL